MNWDDKLYLDVKNDVQGEVRQLLRQINRGERTYSSVIAELGDRLSHAEARLEVEKTREYWLKEARDTGQIPNTD